MGGQGLSIPFKKFDLQLDILSFPNPASLLRSCIRQTAIPYGLCIRVHPSFPQRVLHAFALLRSVSVSRQSQGNECYSFSHCVFILYLAVASCIPVSGLAIHFSWEKISRFHLDVPLGEIWPSTSDFLWQPDHEFNWQWKRWARSDDLMGRVKRRFRAVMFLGMCVFCCLVLVCFMLGIYVDIYIYVCILVCYL